MASPSGFWYGWFTLVILYYGFGFVWFGVGVLNYIPDPPYGFAWALVLLSIFQFIGPVVIAVDFYLFIVGVEEMHELSKYYLIFMGFLKFIKGYVIYSILFIACSRYGTWCQFIPTDGVPADPTRSTVWIVLYTWEMVESFVIIALGLLYSVIPYYSRQAKIDLVKEYLKKKYGDSVDFDACALFLVDDAETKGKSPLPTSNPLKIPLTNPQQLFTTSRNRGPPKPRNLNE